MVVTKIFWPKILEPVIMLFCNGKSIFVIKDHAIRSHPRKLW